MPKIIDCPAWKTGKRINAVKTCKQNEWGLGVVLESSCWNEPRVIRKIDYATVWTSVIREDGTLESWKDAATFPSDVKVK
jgi:hypothetical protein